MRISRPATLSLRTVALLYLAVLLLLPLGVVFFRTFEHGFGVAWGWMTTPAAVSAFWLTLLMAAIAVPLNTIFGVGTAMVLIRGKAPGRKFLDSLIDLPFVVSPVIVGLALILEYGQLIEVGDEQEQAAATLGASRWQTFWRVTLPSIRWGVAYGVVLTTARALGEIGAVLVVSSNVAGSTLTLPLLVYQRDSQPGAQAVTGAYAAATELIVLSLVVLVAMTVLGSRRSVAR